jgi:hypothetical protein
MEKISENHKNLTIKSTKGLRKKGKQLRNQIFKVAKKINKNPHRGDFIPAPEMLESLMCRRDQLIELKRSFINDQLQFDWDMHESLSLLKDLYKMSVAHRELMKKL